MVAAGIGLLGLLIAITTIRVPRQELSGAVPAPPETAPQPAVSQPVAQQPVTVQRQEDRAALAAAARPCRLASRRVVTTGASYARDYERSMRSIRQRASATKHRR
jgi:hypothetical protein